MSDPIKILNSELNDRVRSFQKRPGITQILAPFYHNDGDMHEVFIQKGEQAGTWMISDFGMTMMKLSYSYDSLSDGRETLVQTLATENGLTYEHGALRISSSEDSLFFAFMGMQRAISQIMSLSFQKQIRTSSTFIQEIVEALMDKLADLNPQKDYLPVNNREDLLVDICIPSQRPIFIFPVRDDARYLRAGLTCSQLKDLKVKSKSLVLIEDDRAIKQPNFKTVTNLVDKQLFGKDSILNFAPEFVRNEIGA